MNEIFKSGQQNFLDRKSKTMTYMDQAIEEAMKAYRMGEVPVGAVIVKNRKIIGRGHNMVESMNDPSLHAEIVAIREAAKSLGTWRLKGCTMYVSLEPCPMCAGALVLARLDCLVYGARDEKKGCCGSLMDLTSEPSFNHKVESIYMEDKRAARILTMFFQGLRARQG